MNVVTKFSSNLGDVYVSFKCPGCKGSHVIPFQRPPHRSKEITWQFNNDLERPTLKPSILARAYEDQKVVDICHSFVTDGKIQFLSDCTHAFAGKTVPLEHIS